MHERSANIYKPLMALEHILGPQVAFGTIYKANDCLSESRNNLCEEGFKNFFLEVATFDFIEKRAPKNCESHQHRHR
jgi:hypothetical protein